MVRGPKRQGVADPVERGRTIRLIDVARDAGVSVMTVSNVVRGKTKVREETRRLVDASISRLGYRPNLSARSLRLSRNQSVGFVIADSDPEFLSDPFISRLVSGLSNYLSNIDFTLDVQGVLPERFSSATILKKVGNDALCAIVSGPMDMRREHIACLERLSSAVVVFQEHYRSESPHLMSVNQDDRQGGVLIGEHLAKRRVRSIVFLRAMLDWCAVEQREKGLRAALARRRPSVDVKTIVSPSEGFDDTFQTVRSFLVVNKPDAIVAATDSMAAAVLKACESLALNVPKDVLVTGFNGFGVHRCTSPSLTTIASPVYEMGRMAGEFLSSCLETGRFPRRSHTLEVTLVQGAST